MWYCANVFMTQKNHLDSLAKCHHKLLVEGRTFKLPLNKIGSKLGNISRIGFQVKLLWI